MRTRASHSDTKEEGARRERERGEESETERERERFMCLDESLLWYGDCGGETICENRERVSHFVKKREEESGNREESWRASHRERESERAAQEGEGAGGGRREGWKWGREGGREGEKEKWGGG